MGKRIGIVATLRIRGGGDVCARTEVRRSSCWVTDDVDGLVGLALSWIKLEEAFCVAGFRATGGRDEP